MAVIFDLDIWCTANSQQTGDEADLLRIGRTQIPSGVGGTADRLYVCAMCGRVRLSSDVSEIRLVFSIPEHRPLPNIPPSWNVAPTDLLPIVR